MYDKPTLSGLHNFHKLLKYNATNIPTELTNGKYGLLPMIISPTDWETLYGHKWILPNDPGSPPILVVVKSTASKNNIIHIHHNEANKYNLIINTKSALKKNCEQRQHQLSHDPTRGWYCIF